MKSEHKIGVFRQLKPSQLITKRDVDHWFTEQARHNTEKDHPNHQCCFVR